MSTLAVIERPWPYCIVNGVEGRAEEDCNENQHGRESGDFGKTCVEGKKIADDLLACPMILVHAFGDGNRSFAMRLSQ
jgi:hypothetical protein